MHPGRPRNLPETPKGKVSEEPGPGADARPPTAETPPDLSAELTLGKPLRGLPPVSPPSPVRACTQSTKSLAQGFADAQALSCRTLFYRRHGALPFPRHSFPRSTLSPLVLAADGQSELDPSPF